MRFYKFLFIVLFFNSHVLFFNCNKAKGDAKSNGPLFLQVHFTSEILNISKLQLDQILSGEILNFKKLGGRNEKFNIYVDEKISRIVKNNYPGIKFNSIKFNKNFYLAGKRSFLGISDIRGLKPYFKALYIDNRLPWGKINRDYSITPDDSYPFVLHGIPEWNSEFSLSVVQTGVTAMTRAFVPAVRRSKDLFSPIKYTIKITSQADLAVTSNEVSFKASCKHSRKNNLIFCSPMDFFKIIKKSGFDIIELTGNHNNDFGPKYNLNTMNMIKKSGMIYFGGGVNKKDAESVKYISLKNTTIAFIGFNESGPISAWATERKPGAAKLSEFLMKKKILEALKKAKIVFISFQFTNENNPRPWKNQRKYVRLAAETGATIIVSSSAHRVMGMEFINGKFISYGLGNFLFDQMQTKNHRSGLIARHRFYSGRHIQTELIPYLIYNYSQPRLLNLEKAKILMRNVFKYSTGYVFK